MRKQGRILVGLAALATLAAMGFAQEGKAELRIGMIGLDTSHVIAFTQRFNSSPDDPNHVPGGKVVAAYKGGSDDIESSYSRVDGYTKQLQDEYGVTIARECRWPAPFGASPARIQGRKAHLH